MRKIQEFIASVAKEIAAITWPSAKKVYHDTIIVVVALVLSGVAVGLIDYGLNQSFRILLEKITG